MANQSATSDIPNAIRANEPRRRGVTIRSAVAQDHKLHPQDRAPQRGQHTGRNQRQRTGALRGAPADFEFRHYFIQRQANARRGQVPGQAQQSFRRGIAHAVFWHGAGRRGNHRAELAAKPTGMRPPTRSAHSVANSRTSARASGGPPCGAAPTRNPPGTGCAGHPAPRAPAGRRNVGRPAAPALSSASRSAASPGSAGGWRGPAARPCWWCRRTAEDGVPSRSASR